MQACKLVILVFYWLWKFLRGPCWLPKKWIDAIVLNLFIPIFKIWSILSSKKICILLFCNKLSVWTNLEDSMSDMIGFAWFNLAGQHMQQLFVIPNMLVRGNFLKLYAYCTWQFYCFTLFPLISMLILFQSNRIHFQRYFRFDGFCVFIIYYCTTWCWFSNIPWSCSWMFYLLFISNLIILHKYHLFF